MTVMPPVTVPRRAQRTSARPATDTIHRPGPAAEPTAEPPLLGVPNSAYHVVPSSEASKYTVPDDSSGADGLGLADADGDTLAELEPEGEAEPDGLALADGEIDADADGEADADTLELADALALADLEADALAETDDDGEAEPLGDLDALALPLDDGLGDVEPEGLIDADRLPLALAEADGLAEPEGEALAEGDWLALGEDDTDELAEAEALPEARAAMLTWMPRRDMPVTSKGAPLPALSAGRIAPVVALTVPWKYHFWENLRLIGPYPYAAEAFVTPLYRARPEVPGAALRA